MNNERINILYSEQVKVFEKQKECLEQFSKAITSANKIKNLNSQEKNITKIINDFNIIQDNNKILRKETDSAIKHIKKISSPLSFLMFLSIFLSFFISGISLGYLTFTSYLQDEILVNEINKVKEIKDKYYKQLELMSKYQNNDFIFKSNVLIVPDNSVISNTSTGKKGIFFD